MAKDKEPQQAAKRTAEEWAHELGHGKLHAGHFKPTVGKPHYAMAKALKGWPVGAEVTQAEYEQAVADAHAVRIG